MGCEDWVIGGLEDCAGISPRPKAEPRVVAGCGVAVEGGWGLCGFAG